MELDEVKDRIGDYAFGKLSGRIKSFLPPQEQAIKKGLLEGKNIIVSAPTASGKTLIAELAILSAVSKGKKSVYIAPMRALISEKFEDFHRDYPDIKAALSMGDYNESDKDLNKYDVIFVSTEKFDSILRGSTKYVGDVGCIVYDEIHLIGDNDRGPTLEFVIALNKQIFPKAQIIGLSATIGNVETLADWIGAGFVRSDFRPVKLHKKIYLNGELINGDKRTLNNVDDPLLNIAMDLLKRGKQAITFSQTKRSTVSNSRLLAKITAPKLSQKEKEELSKIASNILHALDRPTSQCEELSEIVSKGVAFHHSGLVNKQRKLVEDGFRSGFIKFVVATPTLAMGVNLPANTVIISSVYRYGDFGMETLPAFEIEQMMGRAGRPKYDTEGTAIVISRNDREYDMVKEKYIDGDLEPIVSRFNNEIAIRRYALNLICMGFYSNRNEIVDFFDGLFLSKFDIDVSDKIHSAIDFLVDHGFVEESGHRLEPTRLGKLVNSLYLDPFTGLLFVKFAESQKQGEPMDDFSISHVLFCSGEFKFIRISQSEFEKYEDESYSLNLKTDQNFVEYDRFIAAIKMSHVISDWTDEKTEKYLEEEYKVLPGEFFNLLENLRWLIHGLKEIFKALGRNNRDIIRFSTRVRYGIKQELIPLVSIPEVGRVRARKLYSSGLKTIADVKGAGIAKLTGLLGKRVGESVYRYLHEEKNEDSLLATDNI